jgi:hypothetical protein
MPIRDDEKFREHFLADSAEEAESLLKQYDPDITALASKVECLLVLTKPI